MILEHWKIICLSSLLWFASLGEARAQEVLTNEAIAKMVQAGLSESIILLKVQNSPGNYDVGADALVELKNLGVGDRILQAMIEKSSTGAPAPSPRAARRDSGREKAPVASSHELLATNRTSTMEKEMNGMARVGYEFAGLTFGETTFGGNEVIVGMRKMAEPVYEYKLLATNKTSTMEKEMNQAGALGFRFKEASYGETAGGAEVLVVMERNRNQDATFRYRLLATTKTSTLRKETNAMAAEGYELVDLAHGDTAFGGLEIIAIMELR